MSRVVLVALVVSAAVAAVLALRVPRRGVGVDPIERAARASIPDCSDPAIFERVRDFHVFARRRVPQGTMAFYTGRCAPLLGGGGDRFYGYALVLPGDLHASGPWSRAVGAPVRPGGLVEARRDVACDGGACVATVYGLVRPEVAAVEVAFGGGKSDRMRPVGGAFALIGVGTREVLELRLLDGAGGLLESIPASDIMGYLGLSRPSEPCVKEPCPVMRLVPSAVTASRESWSTSPLWRESRLASSPDSNRCPARSHCRPRSEEYVPLKVEDRARTATFE